MQVEWGSIDNSIQEFADIFLRGLRSFNGSTLPTQGRRPRPNRLRTTPDELTTAESTLLGDCQLKYQVDLT